ncbi:MAG: inositol monophosphatase family protein [Gammaproteobacteria bacterium]|nr:MAG: inositol monophosphatase family protein [Gammaproteobacteria bacterium]
MNPFLNIAVKAARLAGRVISYNAERLDRLTVTAKGHADFVSEVDHLAEQEILHTIKEAYPEHAVFAEESGKTAGNEFEWIIDPLDGTTNFLHGIPQYAVSIAMREKGVLEVAVVFDPIKDELFTAVKGEGALLNDRRIRVSGTKDMEYALLATGFPYKNMKNLDLWTDCFSALAPETSGVRRAGSAALDLAWVAAGRYDGFWEFDLNAWDIAAGVLLIQEAGGMVSEVDGGRDLLLSGDIMGANPAIYRKMLRKLTPIVQKYR